MIKLSVCIPVYNFDVRELVNALKKEIVKRNLSAEIILIDDSSEVFFVSLNSEIQHVVDGFILLKENIGRSKIRNLFLKHAQGQYFLFLDCDGKLIQECFLENYFNFILRNPDCTSIYGGRKVSLLPPNQSYFLRWKFAVERENISLEKRKKNPYLSFQTNNFVIKKEILEKILFNEAYTNYGYEDLLFAMDLKSENVIINHIENPILNNDVETNEVYLEKVKESVDSLSSMLKYGVVRERLSSIKLVKTFIAFDFFPFNFLIIFLFKFSSDFLERKLLKGNQSLRYLDLYKLGMLFKLMK
ncbi:glycosyltransferase [Chryseobacterium sp.]|uniref:glycosyltransferase family 2 protein n=1 Tax=Chryseobacterium sp. TaxID=1871047 RepID=UPI002FCA617F